MYANYGRKLVMARLTRPLSHNEILKAKPQDKDYTLHDGDCLFLLVETSGKSCGDYATNAQVLTNEPT